MKIIISLIILICTNNVFAEKYPSFLCEDTTTGSKFYYTHKKNGGGESYDFGGYLPWGEEFIENVDNRFKFEFSIISHMSTTPLTKQKFYISATITDRYNEYSTNARKHICEYRPMYVIINNFSSVESSDDNYINPKRKSFKCHYKSITYKYEAVLTISKDYKNAKLFEKKSNKIYNQEFPLIYDIDKNEFYHPKSKAWFHLTFKGNHDADGISHSIIRGTIMSRKGHAMNATCEIGIFGLL